MANFYTDVIEKDPRFTSVNRIADIALLEPVTRALLQKIIFDAGIHGIELMVYETYRTQARQAELFAQGATQLKNVGVHHYGLACDIVKNVNGEPSWKWDFVLLGQLAHANKLIWGGNWGTQQQHHNFLDQDDVQRCSIGKQAALFTGAFYPDNDYNPYNDL